MTDDRPGDRPLWTPKHPLPRMASQHLIDENARVREILIEELEHMVADDTRDYTTAAKWGTARRSYAAEWVRVTVKEGLRAPGMRIRTRLDPGEDPVARANDSAHTEIRQFLEGRILPEWELVGIECVACVRRGLPFPAVAYQTQVPLL